MDGMIKHKGNIKWSLMIKNKKMNIEKTEISAVHILLAGKPICYL
jgi:hypothetical protein